ncbi:MAG: UvrD-helicase domain-containing protein, partial [Alphaproteobacteria bacterium]|nr:UvrD-helicase domain-containing protein [Alphaproteobacteria bacterium]
MTTNNEAILSQRQNLSRRASSQQQKASNPEKSVWVGASAGTGKTKVLSDRVLRILLNDVNPSKILCLTYTKAAAVEMSSRIAKKLGQWSIISDEKLEKELLSLYGEIPQDSKKREQLKNKARRLFAVLLDTPGGIKIQTIHSFCQEILKRFPLEADVSPYFQVLDDRDSKEAINDIKNHILTEASVDSQSNTGRAIAYITANISENKFPKIIEDIITNRGKIEQTINLNNGKKNLLALISQKLNIDDNLTIEQILKQFFDNLPTETLQKLSSSGIKDIDTWLDGNYNIEDYKKYLQIFLTNKNEIKSTSKKKIFTENPNVTQSFTEEAERCLKLIEKIK